MDRETHETPIVLLIEDENLVRRVLVRKLVRCGFHVREAASGLQALSLLDESRPAPHLIISDVIMPDMNGRDIVEKMKLRWPSAKVLFMSGYPSAILLNRGVLKPSDAFIEKSMIHTSLLDRIKAMLNLSR